MILLNIMAAAAAAAAAAAVTVLAWRIPGTVEPGGLPSIGSDTTEAT